MKSPLKVQMKQLIWGKNLKKSANILDHLSAHRGKKKSEGEKKVVPIFQSFFNHNQLEVSTCVSFWLY